MSCEYAISLTSEIAEASDDVLSCLVMRGNPEKEIMDHYFHAKNKDAFVAGLAATLLLRHRQWQAATGQKVLAKA